MYYGLTTGMNYLIGKRKSRLELGLGNQLRLISSKLLVAYMGKESYISIKSENKTQVRDFLYMNVGYRYTSTHGFQFRCGVTPMINTTNGWTTSDNAYSKGDVFLIPYVSFGKAF